MSPGRWARHSTLGDWLSKQRKLNKQEAKVSLLLTLGC